MEQPITEIKQKSTPIRELPEAERKRYYRENKRKERNKNRKCIRCGAQATIKVLATQELLCDKEDVERLKNRYKKKETPT
jgi:ribosomal protein S27AE